VWTDHLVKFSLLLKPSFSDLTFFAKKDDLRQDLKVYFTGLLFQFGLAVLSNNHGISEITAGQLNRTKYGLAFYPKSASLMNHSCNPNTGTVVIKNMQITVATKKIEPGEEICHIYQGHFADTCLQDRQSLMVTMYHFKCTCLACTLDYPMFKDLPGDFDNQEYLSLGICVQEACDKNDFATATELLIQGLKLVCQHLKQPHQIFLRDRALLLECLWLCFGNKTFQLNQN
jgi:hypothetical protein